jgi:hypothetical protein
MSLLRVLTIRSPRVRSSIALADAVSPWTGLPMGMKGWSAPCRATTTLLCSIVGSRASTG